ncbi:hypothetical protein Tco_1379528 [Tanacetum coccineum]
MAEYINSSSWNRPAFFDDDDDDKYTIQYREYLENSSNAITPVLPIEEPDNSLSMGDEHLSTIPEMESDEVTKSSVEDLVPILSDSKGISNDTCDVPFCDNSPPLDVLNDQFEIFSHFNNDCTSSDDDSFEDIDYVEASPPDSELVSLEEVKDDILHEKLLNINLLFAYDLPSSNEFSPISNFEEKSVTFPNPLFDSNDDFSSSDNDSLSDEDVPEDNFKIYSNPLFEFDDEYISSDVNPLFNEVLEDIECKDSYDFNLDESTFLVTPLFNSNEDECLTSVDDIELLLYHDPSIRNEWKKILYDAPIDDVIFDPGGDIDEINAFLDIDISTDIEDGYHDSEGDILYLESFLSNDTILTLPPKVFLDHDPRSLGDINDLKIMVKIFDPGIHEKKKILTYVSLPFEDRHYLSFTYVIRIFLPYFTYPMDSFLPLSSGSEDTIFDPDIFAFHFSSLEPVAFESQMEDCSIAPDFKDSRAHGFVHRPLDL